MISFHIYLITFCNCKQLCTQEYIRDQPDNIKSVKTIAELVSFLNAVYTNITKDNIDLVIQLFSTLNEFTCGNQPSMSEVVACKVIDLINVILRAGEYPDCEIEKVIVNINHFHF